jgi:hypothetical protein
MLRGARHQCISIAAAFRQCALRITSKAQSSCDSQQPRAESLLYDTTACKLGSFYVAIDAQTCVNIVL